MLISLCEQWNGGAISQPGCMCGWGCCARDAPWALAGLFCRSTKIPGSEGSVRAAERDPSGCAGNAAIKQLYGLSGWVSVYPRVCGTRCSPYGWLWLCRWRCSAIEAGCCIVNVFAKLCGWESFWLLCPLPRVLRFQLCCQSLYWSPLSWLFFTVY